MQHFPDLAHIHSTAVRYALIVLHLPVIAYALVVHMIGGFTGHTVTLLNNILGGTHNYLAHLLNASSSFVQGMANHTVVSVSSVLSDIKTVAAGKDDPLA